MLVALVALAIFCAVLVAVALWWALLILAIFVMDRLIRGRP